MIFTDRTITVRKGESRIDEPIVVYRGDYELEVRFTILNSRFKFMSGTNMIESEKASYGQLAILTPYGGNIFSDIVRCNDGSVTFVLTAEMLNQIEEVGLYSFQIRLMDYNKESRVSIPPIEFGIEVREPIASEDHDNSVNNAIVGYSIAKVVDPKEENVGDTFDESGNYNKTKWETGDRISEGKLNKIEDAIDKVNKNEMNNSASLSKRIDNNFNVLDSIMEEEIREIESELAQTNAQLSQTKNEMNLQLETKTKLEFVGNTNKVTNRVMVTFIDDDGRNETLSKFAPIFRETGVPFVFAPSTGLVGDSTHMSWEEITQLYNEGNEVASHGVSHIRLEDLDLTQAEYELKQSFIDFKNHGIECHHHVYVGGSHTKGTVDLTKKYYNSATITAFGYNPSPIDQFRMLRTEMETKNFETAYKGRVDKAINDDAWLIFMCHSWYPNYLGDNSENDQIKAIKDTIDYCKSLNIPIVTIQQGLEFNANYIDLGSELDSNFVKLGKNGLFKYKIDGVPVEQADYAFLKIKATGVTSLTPITFFKKGFVSVNTFVNSDNRDFPDTKAGTLKTYKITDNNDLGFQEWYPYQSDRVYKRYWKKNDTWSSWKLIGGEDEYLAVTIPRTTIQANSSVDFDFQLVGVAAGDVITVSPNFGLEDNIGFNAFVPSTGNFKIRLLNIGTSEKIVTERMWHCRVRKNL